MNFDQIESFYLVATLGTFQRAAERLNATQPAISARIQALETQLNVKLFDRSGHRVALTREGRSFLPHAEEMLRTRAAALLELGRPGQMRGTVRIGASDTLVASWLPDFVVDLRRQYPEINVGIRVRASPLLQDDLLGREIDVGFVLGPVSHPAVVNHDLCRCETGLVAVPGFGLHGRKLTGGDLEGIDLLTFEATTLPYQQLREDLRAARIDARINPISALHSIILLTLRGLGIGVVPLIAVERELAEGRLVRLDPPIPLRPQNFTVSYLAGPYQDIGETVARTAIAFLAHLPERDFIKKSY